MKIPYSHINIGCRECLAGIAMGLFYFVFVPVALVVVLCSLAIRPFIIVAKYSKQSFVNKKYLTKL